MPTYTRADKYDVLKGYSGVRWGDKSKILDTELLEMQKMLNGRITALGSQLITDGFVALAALTYSSGFVTVPAATIVIGGIRLVFADNMSIAAPFSSNVYLSLIEKEVAYTDTVYKQGNLSGGVPLADNGIYDSVFGAETSRRIQYQLQLSLVNTDPTKTYIAVATINGSGVITDARPKSTLVANNPLFTGATIDGGGQVLSLKPGAVNNTYMAFYARTATPGIRSAYFGYAAAGTNTLSLVNEISGGDINIATAGAGLLQANGNTIHHAGNHNTTGDPHTQYLLKTGGSLSSSLTVNANNSRYILNRPSGQTGQYAGLLFNDNTTTQGAFYWDFTNGKFVLSQNGGSTLYDLLHDGNHGASGDPHPQYARRETSPNNVVLASTAEATIASFTPLVAGNYFVGAYFRVVTGTTVVTVKITYTDATGAQTTFLMNAQSCPIGSYTVPVTLLPATAALISVKVTASVANQVFASASIVEV